MAAAAAAVVGKLMGGLNLLSEEGRGREKIEGGRHPQQHTLLAF